ncbi:MAG: chemotaxis-specific protein-glutamate methyltransferase CheB [Planctomycetota bacterium]
MTRVLIIDDSSFVRRVLERAMSQQMDLRVVGEAVNGRDGIDQIKKLRPDAVTLDVEMPVMDGLATLTAMKQELGEKAPPVLMCSTLTAEGTRVAIEALHRGASDVIGKDSATTQGAGFQAELVSKLRAIAAKRVASCSGNVSKKPPALQGRRFGVLMIGSSTGGPPVVEEMVRALPARHSVPVVVAQHMPSQFTASLAERLNELSPTKVVLAKHGMPLQGGTVYIAEGGLNTTIAGGRTAASLQVRPAPASTIFKPNVDALLSSGAQVFGQLAAGVVVTGMGDDGFIGGSQIAKAGGLVLTQSPETCVVFGMPKKLTETGTSAASLSPAQLAQSVRQISELGLSPAPGAGAGVTRRSA